MWYLSHMKLSPTKWTSLLGCAFLVGLSHKQLVRFTESWVSERAMSGRVLLSGRGGAPCTCSGGPNPIPANMLLHITLSHYRGSWKYMSILRSTQEHIADKRWLPVLCKALLHMVVPALLRCFWRHVICYWLCVLQAWCRSHMELKIW